MAYNTTTQLTTQDWILQGEPHALNASETILTNASRSGDLVDGTLMAQITASGKWVPFTDATATDGSAVPSGFYRGPDITEAAIKAGDVTGVTIITGDALLDENLITIENSLTLATALGATIELRTVATELRRYGFHFNDAISTGVQQS